MKYVPRCWVFKTTQTQVDECIAGECTQGLNLLGLADTGASFIFLNLSAFSRHWAFTVVDHYLLPSFLKIVVVTWWQGVWQSLTRVFSSWQVLLVISVWQAGWLSHFLAMQKGLVSPEDLLASFFWSLHIRQTWGFSKTNRTSARTTTCGPSWCVFSIRGLVPKLSSLIFNISFNSFPSHFLGFFVLMLTNMNNILEDLLEQASFLFCSLGFLWVGDSSSNSFKRGGR